MVNTRVSYINGKGSSSVIFRTQCKYLVSIIMIVILLLLTGANAKSKLNVTVTVLINYPTVPPPPPPPNPSLIHFLSVGGGGAAGVQGWTNEIKAILNILEVLCNSSQFLTKKPVLSSVQNWQITWKFSLQGNPILKLLIKLIA